MAKRAKDLTAIEIKRLDDIGTHSVGGVAGLYFQVSSPTAKSWLLRAMIGKRRRWIGLGPYPEVSLANARDLAREMRQKIKAGIDPIEERRALKQKLANEQASRVTFSEAAAKYLTSKKHEFKNAKHFKQWETTLETYANPFIGDLPVSEIQLSHIIQILESIWLTKTETAKRIRGRIENVLDWATVSGFREGENPARWKGHLENIFPKPSKIAQVKHHKALPWPEISSFMLNLKKRDGIGARALEFLILTSVRSGELRFAVWDEIDIDNKLWTIPSGRMKMAREHRVPLSSRAVDLLKALPKDARKSYIFPALRGGALSDMSISSVLKRMNVEAVPHGFRSTFRDWAAETTDYPNIVVEMALAHSIGNKVEAAYRRGDLLDKRVNLMEDWADYIFKK